MFVVSNTSPILRRGLLAAVIILIVGAAAVPRAEARMDPAAFINNLGSQLVVLAENPSNEARRAAFRRLFHKEFDVHRLGWFVLGPISRTMTPEQRQQFVALFEAYVVATYSDRLSDYVADGGAPRIIGSRPEPDGAIVYSEFSGRSGEVRVDWRLRPFHDAYKITDLIIDGVSMAVNGRSELEGVAERNGWQPQAILAVMRQETADALLR
jgi:phospholipid transport system substrate-binding protein